MISGQFLKRKNLRLRDYDYSSSGFYFITICAKNREHQFGMVVGAGPCAGPKMVLNDVGLMVESVWKEIPGHYPGVGIDQFIVMPNHVHGIIRLMSSIGRPRGAAPTIGLPDVIHRFKSLTTTRYCHGVTSQHWLPFSGSLWQRSYYERVIRNENELNEIRQYVLNNPTTWEQDPERVDSNAL